MDFQINDRDAEKVANKLGWKIGDLYHGSLIEGFRYSQTLEMKLCVVAVVKIGGAYTTQALHTAQPAL